MNDETTNETKDKKENKKNPIQRLKEGFDDKEEQLQVLSTFVRLGVVVWSGFILTLNYVELPGLGKQERIDPTFIASVFTGALASFGLETAKKRGDGTYKADEEKKRAEAANGSVTTMRFETGVKIIPIQPRQERLETDPISGRDIDPENGRLT